MDISGMIDGYYSVNFNRPTDSIEGISGFQVNQLYNFNDKTDQFNLSAAKLTLNHDPDPIGAHVDFFYGRTNALFNGGSASQLDYIDRHYYWDHPEGSYGADAAFDNGARLRIHAELP